MKDGEPIEFTPFPVISQEMLSAYAKASGDTNRIHLEEETARQMGLPGVIAHGMLIAAFIAERARRFGQEQRELHSRPISRIQLRFQAMTLLGDQVSIGGVIERVSSDGVSIVLRARNRRGEIVATGAVEYRHAVAERR